MNVGVEINEAKLQEVPVLIKQGIEERKMDVGKKYECKAKGWGGCLTTPTKGL